MFAREQCGACERMVAVVRRGDHDQVDALVGGKRRVVGDDPQAVPKRLHPSRIARRDGSERQAVHGLDQRRMERAADVAEADQADLDHRVHEHVLVHA